MRVDGYDSVDGEVVVYCSECFLDVAIRFGCAHGVFPRRELSGDHRGHRQCRVFYGSVAIVEY